MTELLQAKGLTRSFRQGNEEILAVDNVEINLSRGESLAVMGPSGCGKSTLLNMIGLLLMPSSGTVLVEGTDIWKMGDSRRAAMRNQTFGYVYQDFALLENKTVLENVAMPLEFAKPKIPRKARIAAAREKIAAVGLEDKEKVRVSNLSGGERQRVAIARAIVNSPKIILADEPTGALDRKNGERIMDILLDVTHQDTSLIVVTHDKFIADKCSRTIYMADGKIQN